MNKTLKRWASKLSVKSNRSAASSNRSIFSRWNSRGSGYNVDNLVVHPNDSYCSSSNRRSTYSTEEVMDIRGVEEGFEEDERAGDKTAVHQNRYYRDEEVFEGNNTTIILQADDESPDVRIYHTPLPSLLDLPLGHLASPPALTPSNTGFFKYEVHPKEVLVPPGSVGPALPSEYGEDPTTSPSTSVTTDESPRTSSPDTSGGENRSYKLNLLHPFNLTGLFRNSPAKYPRKNQVHEESATMRADAGKEDEGDTSSSYNAALEFSFGTFKQPSLDTPRSVKELTPSQSPPQQHGFATPCPSAQTQRTDVSGASSESQSHFGPLSQSVSLSLNLVSSANYELTSPASAVTQLADNSPLSKFASPSTQSKNFQYSPPLKPGPRRANTVYHNSPRIGSMSLSADDLALISTSTPKKSQSRSTLLRAKSALNLLPATPLRIFKRSASDPVPAPSSSSNVSDTVALPFVETFVPLPYSPPAHIYTAPSRAVSTHADISLEELLAEFEPNSTSKTVPARMFRRNTASMKIQDGDISEDDFEIVHPTDTSVKLFNGQHHQPHQNSAESSASSDTSSVPPVSFKGLNRRITKLRTIPSFHSASKEEKEDDRAQNESLIDNNTFGEDSYAEDLLLSFDTPQGSSMDHSTPAHSTAIDLLNSKAIELLKSGKSAIGLDEESFTIGDFSSIDEPLMRSPGSLKSGGGAGEWSVADKSAELSDEAKKAQKNVRSRMLDKLGFAKKDEAAVGGDKSADLGDEAKEVQRSIRNRMLGNLSLNKRR